VFDVGRYVPAKERDQRHLFIGQTTPFSVACVARILSLVSIKEA